MEETLQTKSETAQLQTKEHLWFKSQKNKDLKYATRQQSARPLVRKEMRLTLEVLEGVCREWKEICTASRERGAFQQRHPRLSEELSRGPKAKPTTKLVKV